MSTYTLYYDEKYKCPYCNKIFDDFDTLIDNSWKCPNCKEYIHIAAPNLGCGHTLIRKSVSELKKYDSVHLQGGDDFHDVIAIKKDNTTKIRVALKNYGQLTFDATDFVSVVIGGYYEKNWE